MSHIYIRRFIEIIRLSDLTIYDRLLQLLRFLCETHSIFNDLVLVVAWVAATLLVFIAPEWSRTVITCIIGHCGGMFHMVKHQDGNAEILS